MNAETGLAGLSGGHVLIYTANPDHIADGPDREAWIAALTAPERERFRRFIPDGVRFLFLTGRALLRSALAGALDCAPGEIEFAAGEHGKLALAGRHAGRVEFNLSHTHGLVACAMGGAGAVGIDVERIDPRRAARDIARRFFSAREAEDLGRFQGEAFTRRFFQTWTLKEAYIKARGLGMSLPLARFYFELDRMEGDARREGGRIVMGALPGLDDDPARWRFRLYRPSEEHYLAAACRAERGGEPEFDVRHVRPRLDGPPECL